MFPGDVAFAGAHVEISRVVEEREDAVGPESGPSEFNDAFVILGEAVLGLALQSFLGDIRNHVHKDGVARLGLDSPLAELNTARVPVGPVRAVRVGFNSNHHAIGTGWHIGRYPIHRRLQRSSVNVRVNTASGEQDQVTEEVGLQDWEGEGIVGLDDLRHGCVEVTNKVYSNLVGDDFVDEVWVHDCPACLRLAELLSELAHVWGVLPCLPDVCRELAVDIVGELVLKLLAEWSFAEDIERDLGLGLLCRRLRSRP